ncbi:MAG: efflux RND transporter permease subunit, partial [Candidatus Omnitrophica bacterium]|nr:efflux RND transporter permease subunit [Candidatus Omnitrophota bacterium]
FNMPAGTKLGVTNRVAESAEKFILSIPETNSVSTTVGSTKESTTKSIVERLDANQAELVIDLKKKRKSKSSDIVQIIKNKLAAMDLEGASVEYILQENVLAAGMAVQAPVTLEIKGNELKVLEDIAYGIERRLGSIPGIYGIKDNLSEPSPETKVFIDKDKASMYGLSVTDIAQTALIGIKGYISSKLKQKGEEYDIRVSLRKQDRDNFSKLSRLDILSPSGVSVQLSSVATFSRGKGPSEIRRLNQERVVTVSANVYDRPIKDVISDVNQMITGLNVPKNYIVKLTGETEDMKASFNSMQNAIIAAFLLVYMIMAALFESLWQPLIIMFTIPLSLIGVSLGLFFTGTSISAYVFMGVGILGGIVVNNAIVLIDYINQSRSKGMSAKDAAIYSSKVRLRPILMTALTTILGLAPMAFIKGEGSELRSPMAITVMGGLAVATFLTLIVIPTVYLGVHDITKKIFKKKQ